MEEYVKRITELINDALHMEATAEHGDYDAWVDNASFFGWKASTEAAIKSLPFNTSNYYDIFVSKVKSTMIEDVQSGRSILEALLRDINNGYLENAEIKIVSNTYADLLSTATDYLEQGFKAPAGVLAGVALEDTIRRIGQQKLENYDSTWKFGRINTELGKVLYNNAKRNELEAWYKVRDLSIHAKWDDFDETQARGMIECVNKLIADYL